MYTFMHGFTPLYSPFGPALMFAIIPLILLVAVWTVAIKGYALWHAARANQMYWFIALLIINTLGILELIYLFWFHEKPKHEHHQHTPAQPSSPA